MISRYLLSLSIVAIGLLLGGCSKKPVAENAGLIDPVVAKTPNPQINADLNQINKDLATREYGAAVGSLVSMKQLPKTDAEQKAYDQQLHQTSDILNQRAAQGDEQAAQNYRVLGRFMTGR